MALGDMGGAVTELVITCKTPTDGTVAIERGDALCLAGPYTVTNDGAEDGPVFGQALAAEDRNGAALPVKVRGICLFTYTGSAPVLDGASGVTAAATAGRVQAPAEGAGSGLIVAVNEAGQRVHVLL